MRSAVVLLAACGFSNRAGTVEIDAPGTESDACVASGVWFGPYAHRFPITTTAPMGYTARIDATAALALSMHDGDDVRVVVDHTTELDRAIDGNAVEFRVPASGTLWLYTNGPTGTPPSNPSAIYTWSESFETLTGNGTPRFAPQTPVDWTVVDDAGNRVYRAVGGGRHPAPIASFDAAHVDVRARIRFGPGGTQNHNGVLVRGSNVVPATLDGFVGQLMEDSERSRIAEYIDGISPPTERAGFARPVDRNIWYAMRLTAIGARLDLYIDGTLEVTTNLGTANGTTVGLFAHDTDVDYDDVRVRRLTDPEPTMTIGAREDRMCE